MSGAAAFVDRGSRETRTTHDCDGLAVIDGKTIILVANRDFCPS